MEDKNKNCEKMDEKLQKNASKIEKTENLTDFEIDNGEISRTRMHAIYVKETKQEEDKKRGGRFGIREK